MLFFKLGILNETQSEIKLAKTFSDSFDKNDLADLILLSLKQERLAKQVAKSVQFNASKSSILLDKLLLPERHNRFPKLLLDLNIVSRKKISDRHWVVGDKYKTQFIELCRYSNEKEPENGLSLEQLEEKLARQRDAGRKAEAWVLDYEKVRLTGHALIDNVRIVAEENVSLGYDIVSFNSASDLHLNRFIEVKSFKGEEKFYWSNLEILKAVEYANNYYLYIIDRAKMTSRGYLPQIIKNPYHFWFVTKPGDWVVASDGYVISRK